MLIINKTPASSLTITTEVVCPNDTNPMGILQGGRLLQWMDIAAVVCAQVHAEKICVTASINHVDFNKTAKVRDIITVNAKITRAFKTSMKIFVQSFAREVLAGKFFLISEAYFTFVVLDENGKSAEVISVSPKTISEKSNMRPHLKEKDKEQKKIKQACYYHVKEKNKIAVSGRFV